MGLACDSQGKPKMWGDYRQPSSLRKGIFIGNRWIVVIAKGLYSGGDGVVVNGLGIYHRLVKTIPVHYKLI